MSEQDFQRLTLSMLADIKDRVTKLEAVPEIVARLESGNLERCKARGDLIETIQGTAVGAAGGSEHFGKGL